MRSRVLRFLMLVFVVFIVGACGNTGSSNRRQHPEELVGTYWYIKVDSHNPGEIFKYWTYTLRSDGEIFGRTTEGEWWVENDIIVFDTQLPGYEPLKYNLKTASEDIEYVLEHEFKSLSPNNKNKIRQYFKFRYGDDILIKD